MHDHITYTLCVFETKHVMQDIYSVIFAYITDFVDHVNFSFVSKSTHAVSRQYIHGIPWEICARLIKNGTFDKIIPQFSRIHNLSLSDTGIIDVSCLKNIAIHYLDLSFTEISDVSCLKYTKCHTLNLHDTDVTDVSALGGCHTLDLRYTMVMDVSALGGCHTINLRFAELSDVSALGKCCNVYLYGSRVCRANRRKLIDQGVNVDCRY